MLSEKEAQYYNEQLHPAFAGYLQDGSITDRDSLAAVFYLLTKNFLSPIWQQGNMLKELVGVRKTRRKASLDFDQKLIHLILADQDETSTEKIGDLIRDKSVHDLVRQNLRSIEWVKIADVKKLPSLPGTYEIIDYLNQRNRGFVKSEV